MEQVTVTPTVVAKESIGTLSFPRLEVLQTEDAIKVRAHALDRAIRLGNNQKRKVKIVFEDSSGTKMTETTIWAVTERNILLKGGIFIPINRIHSINPY